MTTRRSRARELPRHVTTRGGLLAVVVSAASVLSGCAHLTHTFGQIYPAGRAFRVELWTGPSSSVGSAVVAEDRVAVAWVSSRTLSGKPVAKVAWARVSSSRGPCGRAAPGDDVRGDLNSLRLECAVGYHAPWQVTTVRRVVAPVAVAVVFGRQRQPVSAWATRRGVWISEPGLPPRIAIRGRIDAVALSGNQSGRLVLAAILQVGGGGRMQVLESTAGRWQLRETRLVTPSAWIAAQALPNGYAVAFQSTLNSVVIEEHRGAATREFDLGITGRATLGLAPHNRVIAAYAGVRLNSHLRVIGLFDPNSGHSVSANDPCHARPIAVGWTTRPVVVFQAGCSALARARDRLYALGGAQTILYGAGTSGPVVDALAGSTSRQLTVTLERGSGSGGRVGYEIALYPSGWR